MKTNQWLADATFKSCPDIFKQFWILYGEFNSQTSPLYYFFMSGATKENYAIALNFLKKDWMKLKMNSLIDI